MPISKDRVENASGRFYKVPDWLLAEKEREGETLWLPSVSTILESYSRPGLLDWYGKLGTEEANRIRDDTAEVGSRAHACIEQIIEGKPITSEQWGPLDTRVKQAVRAYAEWKQTAQFEPVSSELTVYSLKYGFAGTLDATGYFGPRQIFGLADWKTSGGFWKVMFLQLAAYRVAYHETYPKGIRLKEIYSVRFDRDTGLPEEHSMTPKEAKVAFTAFLGILDAWKYLRRGIANER